jgi:hypothetical protein
LLQYRYIDGSGNQYILEEQSLRYLPISPKMSSSGYYSGGTPGEKTVDQQDMDALINLLNEAIATPSLHKKHRELGTGTISLKKNGQTFQYILPRRSTEKRAIEAKLKELMGD